MFILNKLKQFKSWVGHRVSEVILYVDFFSQQKSTQSMIICVDGPKGGFSSGLRGYQLKKELVDLGWRVAVIPHRLELVQRLRIIKFLAPEFLMLQSCRHPLNKTQLYPGVTLVFDLDDADFLDPKLENRVIECAKNSEIVIAGSRYVANFLKQYNQNTHIVWTGSQPVGLPVKAEERGLPLVVTWACSDPHAYAVEAKLISEVMSRLNETVKSKITFSLLGVRNDELAEEYLLPLKQSGVDCTYMTFMDYDKLLQVLGNMTIGLAPLDTNKDSFSAGKSFGKILAYLNAGLVVIASDAADHGLFFNNRENGMLVDNNVEAWVDAVEELVINDEFRNTLMRSGYKSYVERLSIQSCAKIFDKVLNDYNR